MGKLFKIIFMLGMSFLALAFFVLMIGSVVNPTPMYYHLQLAETVLWGFLSYLCTKPVSKAVG